MFPHAEPVLPQYFVTPDDPKSLEAMRKALYERALWEELNTAATKAKKEYAAYVRSLSPDELDIFCRHAESSALEASSKIQNLAGRVSMSIAYRIMSRNTHRVLKEYDTLEQFLLEKLDENPSPKSAREAVFLLEVLEHLDKLPGNARVQANKILSNKFTYGKLVESIRELQNKRDAVLAAETFLKDGVAELKKKKSRLLRDKSAARLKGRPEAELELFDEEVRSVEAQIGELETNSKQSLTMLETDFRATAKAAFDIAVDASVPRSLVKTTLPFRTKQILEEEGLKPEEVNPKYAENGNGKGPQKPTVHVINLDNEIVFVTSVPRRQGSLAIKHLETMFATSFSTLNDGIRELISKKNRRRK